MTRSTGPAFQRSSRSRAAGGLPWLGLAVCVQIVLAAYLGWLKWQSLVEIGPRGHYEAAFFHLMAVYDWAGPRLPAAVRQLAIGLAAAIAMVWAVHPLTTQAVTYIYQRIELLASLCMLTCLLATNRVWHPIEQTDRLLGWKLLALAAACLAMLSKETAVVLPLLVLLQGWLLTERPAVALRQQGRFLLLLAGSWLVLFAVLLAQRQHYAEIEKAVHPPLAYLLTQAGVIVHYLRLVVWPSGQCLDYDWPLADSPLTVWWQGPLVVAGVVATASGPCHQTVSGESASGQS